MPEVERLLVVDDEAPILHALQRTFEAAGYEVTACADPAEALDRLREKPFQVLSADYMMPGMTGAEFLAQAKSLQPETIRILLTAAHDFSAAVDAVNNGEFFRDASVIVLQHQERYDGRGYPSGLKGDQIVLGARLFAVADTYDAITSDRPYRKAQPHEAAVIEMQRVAGTQLDPQGVSAFCAIEEQEWLQIRSEVEKISLVEQEWGWTPPKRVFEQIREAASKQKQPISQPPDGADAKVG